MLTTPAQPASYPYRIKRKPVPSIDLASLHSETDQKVPLISSRAANAACSTTDLQLPQLTYIDRKLLPLYTVPPPPSPSVLPRDKSCIQVPSWLRGRRSHDFELHRITLIPDSATSKHHAGPHYHRRTQSFPATPFLAELPSDPSAAPPPYNFYSHMQIDLADPAIFFPASGLDLTTEGLLPTNMDNNLGVSRSSSQNHASDGHEGYGLPSVSSNTQTPTENSSVSSTTPKEQKFTRFLGPIRSSLIGGTRRDGSQSGGRRRRMSLLLFPPSTGSRSSDSTPSSSPHSPAKRNVLRCPWRSDRNLSSVTTGTTLGASDSPTFKLGVDSELRNLRQQNDLASPLPSQLVIDSPLGQQTLPARLQISSGHASTGRRTLSFSHFQQQKFSKRPTTALAASTPIIVNRTLTQRLLADAASLEVIAESGVRVSFGDLFLRKKTIVIFVRHFWCPYCQDYMVSISNTVNPTILKRTEVDLVVISNGSHDMIQSYRRIFRTPFNVYTDPTQQLYKALGMTLRTLNPGPESQRGAYIKHGVIGGITMVVSNAIKGKMPIWENGGDIEQLGGEFVLGPGLTCTFAHRMQSTRSHAPIQRVLAAAGVDLYARWELPTSISEQSHLTMSEVDEVNWMEERNRSLAALRSKRFLRRCGEASCGPSATYEEEESDDSYENEEQQTMGSARALGGPTDGTNSTSDAEDAKSFSGSVLYQQHSPYTTDEA